MHDPIIPHPLQEKAFGFPLKYPNPSLKILPAKQPSLASECLEVRRQEEGGRKRRLVNWGLILAHLRLWELRKGHF